MDKVYEQRDTVLKSMGFPSYERYLESPLWSNIRTRVFSLKTGQCNMCGRGKPTAIHHQSYGRAVLEGKDLSQLYPLCSSCHYKVEFDEDGTKLAATEAILKFNRLRKKRKSKPWIGLAHKAKYLRRYRWRQGA